MATLQDVNDIFGRVRRLQARVVVTDGPGAEWKAEVPGFGMQTYKVTGMKSPSEIEDDLAALSVWIWSLKDHFKALLPSIGRDETEVERFVDSERDLRVCSDLANGAKHLTLRISRSGQFLRAGRLRFRVPQSAIATLIVRENEVQIDVSKPAEVTIELPVLDQAGNIVGDGISYLHNGVRAWERYSKQLGLSV